MGYYRTLDGISAQQKRALVAVTEDDIEALPTYERLELAIREREAFWNALQAFATGALPILAFLGVTKAFRG